MRKRLSQILTRLGEPRTVETLRAIRINPPSGIEARQVVESHEASNDVAGTEGESEAIGGGAPNRPSIKGRVFRHYVGVDCRKLATSIVNSPFDIITATELAQELTTCLLAVPPDKFDIAMMLVEARIRAIVGDTGANVIPLHRGIVVPVLANLTMAYVRNRRGPLAFSEMANVLVSYGGIIEGTETEEEVREAGGTLHVEITGGLSPKAWEAVSSFARLVVPCVFESMLGERVIESAIYGHAGEWRLGRRKGQPPESADLDIPDISSSFVDKTEPLIRESLHILMNPDQLGKVEKTFQRVRRALVLLAHARIQTDPAVALTLAMAALEAILSFGKDAISDHLSRFAATLLVPESSERLEYMRRIKRLYTLRSELVHGTKDTEVDVHLSAQVMAFVGICIRAVLDWRRFRVQAGLAHSPEELKEELEQTSAGGGQVVGVPEWYWMLVPDPKSS